MDNEDKRSTSGGGTLDRKAASARVSDYLRREGIGPASDADRRADEILAVLGGGAALAMASVGALASNWWLFALRGVLAILFGVLALVHPLAALTAFVLVFGIWAFIDGVNALVVGLSGWRSWQLALGGAIGIAVGVLTFFRPGITALALYSVVAAWSVFRGVLEIAVAIELRKRIRGEVWLVFAGVASILFGVLMIALPAAGVLALAWLIGIYALLFGGLMLALAVRLRKLHRGAERVERPLRTPTIQPA